MRRYIRRHKHQYFQFKNYSLKEEDKSFKLYASIYCLIMAIK